MKNPIFRLVGLSLALLLSGAKVHAASTVELQAAGANVTDSASLQRGARLFMNYCVSCHSMQYLRYSRLAEDLGLSEEQVMQNLNFTGAKFGETILASMVDESASQWFGAAPPDLSLTARSRGVDWIYTYLKSFYVDETRSHGWNNTLLPGAAMPHVLWELQGIQHHADAHAPSAGESDAAADHADASPFTLASAGMMSPAEYDGAVRDIANFMQYAAEPAVLQREKYGVWVILFLAGLTFLLYLLKQEYWRDVH